ncbi:MAG: S26 family signal peptidase [Bacillota bacterium]
MGKCMITLISIVLILSGCQEAVLQDPYTKEEINLVKPSEGTFLIRAQNDSMLGVSDYLSNDLVVDPDAYKEKAIQRGDVIYLVNPPFQSSTNPKLVLADKGILRVIGLSGEKNRMEKGQIYINNKRLDTFYPFSPRGLPLL